MSKKLNKKEIANNANATTPKTAQEILKAAAAPVLNDWRICFIRKFDKFDRLFVSHA